MNQKLNLQTAAGILLVTILGTLSHFAYEWSGNQALIGFFTPVNESVWEHMKLIFFPMVLYTVIETQILKSSFPCIACASAIGILAGTLAMPVLFYVYSGILGTNYLFLDILTFFICVLIAFYCSVRFTKSCICQDYTPVLITLVICMAAAFLVFTVNPPALGIFQS